MKKIKGVKVILYFKNGVKYKMMLKDLTEAEDYISAIKTMYNHIEWKELSRSLKR